MLRSTTALLLSAFLLAACTVGGKTFTLMAGSNWRVTLNGIAYALELRPGNEAIVWRIDGDSVTEEVSAPDVPLAIVGLLGDDLVVRRGGPEEILLRISARGGSSVLTTTEAATDQIPAACGPVGAISNGAAIQSGGCPVGDAAYLFDAAGHLFRVADGIAQQIELEGRVVELYALPSRVWVGVVTTPADVVHYTAIDEPTAP